MLIYLLALFIVRNLKKIITADPELWGCAIFGSKMVHCPPNVFLLQTIITFIYLLALSIVQNLKKNLQHIQRCEDMQFLAPNENFFRKPINEPCFFDSCLSTCQNQSQILIY